MQLCLLPAGKHNHAYWRVGAHGELHRCINVRACEENWPKTGVSVESLHKASKTY